MFWTQKLGNQGLNLALGFVQPPDVVERLHNENVEKQFVHTLRLVNTKNVIRHNSNENIFETNNEKLFHIFICKRMSAVKCGKLVFSQLKLYHLSQINNICIVHRTVFIICEMGLKCKYLLNSRTLGTISVKATLSLRHPIPMIPASHNGTVRGLKQATPYLSLTKYTALNTLHNKLTLILDKIFFSLSLSAINSP